MEEKERWEAPETEEPVFSGEESVADYGSLLLAVGTVFEVRHWGWSCLTCTLSRFHYACLNHVIFSYVIIQLSPFYTSPRDSLSISVDCMYTLGKIIFLKSNRLWAQN